GAGAGLFTFTGGGTLTGSGPNPGVAAGQTVTIASGIETDLAKNLTNAGTLTLGDAGNGYSILGGGPNVTLTNSGQLNTVTGCAACDSRRFLRLNINNAPGGTVDIAAPTIQDNGGW